MTIIGNQIAVTLDTILLLQTSHPVQRPPGCMRKPSQSAINRGFA